MDFSIASIHSNYVPKYDRWGGKIGPRIKAWFAHIYEFIYLWFKGDERYYKHNRTTGTCRQHSVVEFKDWLWLTAEIVWMLTRMQLPIVPKSTYIRVIEKFEETKRRQNEK